MAADHAKPSKSRRSNNDLPAGAAADSGDGVVRFAQTGASSDIKVDIDLTDNEVPGHDSGTVVDIQLDEQIPDSEDIDITFSSSRSLITRPRSEATIIRGRKRLDKTYREVDDAQDLEEKRVIHPEMEQYEILNAFREIRTEILRQAGGDNQVLMVVSLADGMGSTFSSVNLAASFAFEGERTALLVDCDQRRKKLATVFAQDSEHGLSDYLCDAEIGAEDIINTTFIKRLRYIPMGLRRPEIGELFSTSRMRDLITQIRRRYVDRYIILAAPPLEESVDAAILAEYCDQIVVVVPYGKVTGDRLKKALRLLPREKLTGIVFNNRMKNV